MSKFDLGLSNPYLRFGGVLLLLSVLVALSEFVFGSGANRFRVAGFLLAAGMVVYVIGRIVKATRVPRK